MPIEVTMPKLSPTMETGVIAQWLKKVGDTVKEGDALADIETDKATMQMKSYDDGTIVHIDHAAGDEVALGQRVLVLAKKGEDPKEIAAKLGSVGAPGASSGEKTKTAAEPAAAASGAAHSADNGQQTAAVEQPLAAGGRVKSSPLARKVAAAASVDIRQLSGLRDRAAESSAATSSSTSRRSRSLAKSATAAPPSSPWRSTRWQSRSSPPPLAAPLPHSAFAGCERRSPAAA